jgi:hypothetical protein
MLAALGFGGAAFALAIAAAVSSQWLLVAGDALLVAVNVAVFELNRRGRRSEVRP